MTDAQAKMICRNVSEYLRYKRFDIRKPEDFAQLTEHTWRTVGESLNLDKDEVLTVTAICVFGPESIEYTTVCQSDLGESVPTSVRAIPRGAGLHPPEVVRDGFLHIVREYYPSQPKTDEVWDLCIAFGCGNWRPVKDDSKGYDGLWQGALCALQTDVLRAVTESTTWLGCVAQYSAGSADTLWSDAGLATMILVRPLTPLHIHRESEFEIICTDEGTMIRSKAANMRGQDGDYKAEIPSGSKFVFSIAENPRGALLQGADDAVKLPKGMKIIVNARDGETWIRRAEKKSKYDICLLPGQTAVISGPVKLAVWECSCAWDGCERSHRMDSWNPAKKIKRRSYAKSAIKGPQPNIQATSFTQGVYCGVLAQEGLDGIRLRLAPVEFKVCDRCSVFSPKPHPGFKTYEGDQCAYCKMPFQPEKTHKIASERLIVVGKAPPVYRPALRVRCGNRTAHYRKVTGQNPTGNLPEKWDNLCDIGKDWTLDDEIYLAVETHAPKTPDGYSERDKAEAADELQEAMKKREKALTIHCPLCNELVEIVIRGRHFPPRPTTAWYRTFTNIVERDDPAKWESLEDESDGFDLSAALLRADEEAIVETALGKLDDDDRRLITLYHMQQLSLEEISQEMNVPVDVLAEQLPRAEEPLREHLKGLFDDSAEGVDPDA